MSTTFRPKPVYDRVKRAIDLVGALLLLVLLSPVLAGLAIWVKAGSRGPVFYRGVRVGKGGKSFRMTKFRSMVVDADAVGPPSTADDDPRITPAGKFLRKRKLDELPQLLDIVRGDMSFIGPRPEVEEVTRLYEGEQLLLLQVRPGIVDYGSLWNRDEGAVLEGAADPHQVYMDKILPTKSALSAEYVRSRSLAVDARIAVAAFSAIFLGRDADWALPHDRVDIVDYDSLIGSQRESEEAS